MRDVRPFRMDRRGSVALQLGLLALPLVLSAGAAVDFAGAYRIKSFLQEAADNAALVGAVSWPQGEIAAKAAAAKYLDVNRGALQLASVTVDAITQQTAVKVSVSASYRTWFMGLAGYETLPVAVTAQAVPRLVRVPMCIMALGATGKGVDLTGGSGIAASCALQSNSTATNSMNISGGGVVTTSKNCVVGSVSASGGSTYTPLKEAGCQAVADPFSGLSRPSVGSCSYTNFKGSGTYTLTPGTYCGGLNFGSGANVTVQPGLYIVKDGLLSSSAGGLIQGDGVTFFLTGTGAGVSFSGGPTFKLKAPASGPLSSFIFFLDPTATPAAKSVISGGGNTSFEGIMYFPNQLLEMSGGSTTTSVSPFSAYIAGRILYSGGGQLTIAYDPAKATVPIPPNLMTLINNKFEGARLVN